MKNCILLLLFVLSHNLHSQVTNVTKTQSTANFMHVCDSVVKLTDPQNSVIVKTQEGYCEFYITKAGSHYNGYFIKNLTEEGMPPPFQEGKPIITEIITFDADAIYQDLVKKNVNNIVQLTEDDIQKQKSGRKNIAYSIPRASHDAKVTIIINGPQPKYASYSWGLIQNKDWHNVAVLKTFYNIQQYLISTFKAYY